MRIRLTTFKVKYEEDGKYLNQIGFTEFEIDPKKLPAFLKELHESHEKLIGRYK